MFLSRVSGTAGPSRRAISSGGSQFARLALPAVPHRPLPTLGRPLSTFSTGVTFSRPAVNRFGLPSAFDARRTYASNQNNAGSRRPTRALTGAEWPWTVVEKPRTPGVDEIERVIYARHNKGLGKTFWAMGIIFTSGLITYIIIPSPNTAIERGVTPADENQKVMGMPIATFFTWVTGGFGAIVGAMAIGGLFTMSRMVSRLSLVQQKAHGAAPKTARKFLRMSTSVQESMPLSRGPRELPVSAAQVDLLQGRKNRFGDRETSPYVKLTIHDPNASALTRFFDRVSFRLDFSKFDSGDGELVLSIPRLDAVFGPLEYSNAESK